ncbi:hypothetical protein DACRYDRAFT_116056 [Dacryopinax primogenitus]|uniref:Uncharacterized protein n=1 Tax=Dacryopinax primogenitus (strain DJM 731) TaxID=1858805 RepID=M5FWM3_DACPD|nr:uncharacterized protein DACRYDRAFT_116056 [Dacryopinax primogenitus]EJU02346.1 hypothetical protein DACRYDRAFT_116056 [Dacryopinax primogenitus]
MEDGLHPYGGRPAEDAWEQAYPFSTHQAAINYTAFGVNPSMLNGYHNHSSSHHHAYTHAYHHNQPTLPYTTEDVKPQPFYADSRTSPAISPFTSPTSSRSLHAHYAALTAYNEHVYAARRKDHFAAAAQAAEEEAFYKAAFHEMVCLPDDDEDEVAEGNAGLSEGASSTTVENSPKSVMDHEDETHGPPGMLTVPGGGTHQGHLEILHSEAKAALSQHDLRSTVDATTGAGTVVADEATLSDKDVDAICLVDEPTLSVQDLPTSPTTATVVTAEQSRLETAIPLPVALSAAPTSSESALTSSDDASVVPSWMVGQSTAKVDGRGDDDEQSEPSHGEDNEPQNSSIAPSVKEEPASPIVVDRSLPTVLDLLDSPLSPCVPSSSRLPKANDDHPTRDDVEADVASTSKERSATPAPSPTRSAIAYTMSVVPPEETPSPLTPLDIASVAAAQERSLTPKPSTTRAALAPTPPLPQNLPNASVTTPVSLPNSSPTPPATGNAGETRRGSTDSTRSAGQRVTAYSSEDDTELCGLSMLAEVALVHLSPTERIEQTPQVDLSNATAVVATEEDTSATLTAMETERTMIQFVPIEVAEQPWVASEDQEHSSSLAGQDDPVADIASTAPAVSDLPLNPPLFSTPISQRARPISSLPASEAAIERALAQSPQSSPLPSSQTPTRSFRAIFANIPSSSPSTARAAYFSDEESNEDVASEESETDDDTLSEDSMMHMYTMNTVARDVHGDVETPLPLEVEEQLPEPGDDLTIAPSQVVDGIPEDNSQPCLEELGSPAPEDIVTSVKESFVPSAVEDFPSASEEAYPLPVGEVDSPLSEEDFSTGVPDTEGHVHEESAVLPVPVEDADIPATPKGISASAPEEPELIPVVAELVEPTIQLDIVSDAAVEEEASLSTVEEIEESAAHLDAILVLNAEEIEPVPVVDDPAEAAVVLDAAPALTLEEFKVLHVVDEPVAHLDAISAPAVDDVEPLPVVDESVESAVLLGEIPASTVENHGPLPIVAKPDVHLDIISASAVKEVEPIRVVDEPLESAVLLDVITSSTVDESGPLPVVDEPIAHPSAFSASVIEEVKPLPLVEEPVEPAIVSDTVSASTAAESEPLSVVDEPAVHLDTDWAPPMEDAEPLLADDGSVEPSADLNTVLTWTAEEPELLPVNEERDDPTAHLDPIRAPAVEEPVPLSVVDAPVEPTVQLETNSASTAEEDAPLPVVNELVKPVQETVAVAKTAEAELEELFASPDEATVVSTHAEAPTKVTRLVLDYIQMPPVPPEHRRRPTAVKARRSTEALASSGPKAPALSSSKPLHISPSLAKAKPLHLRALKRARDSAPIETPSRPLKRLRVAPTPLAIIPSTKLASSEPASSSPSTLDSPTLHLRRGPRTTNKLLPRPSRLRLGSPRVLPSPSSAGSDSTPEVHRHRPFKDMSSETRRPQARPKNTFAPLPSRPSVPPLPFSRGGPFKDTPSIGHAYPRPTSILAHPTSHYSGPSLPASRHASSSYSQSAVKQWGRSVSSHVPHVREAERPSKLSRVPSSLSKTAPSRLTLIEPGPSKRRQSPPPPVEPPRQKRVRIEEDPNKPYVITRVDKPKTRNTLLPRPVEPAKIKQEVETIIVPSHLANGVIDLADDSSEDELGRWDDVGMSFVVSSSAKVAYSNTKSRREARHSWPAAKRSTNAYKENREERGRSSSTQEWSDEDDLNQDLRPVMRSAQARQLEPKSILKRPRRGWLHDPAAQSG